MVAPRKAWTHAVESAAQRGYGYQWTKLRASVMRRDAGLCQVCLPLTTLATEVDHITPKAQGGTDDMDNLQAICSECHVRKTDAENGRTTRHQTGADGWPVDDSNGGVSNV